MMLIFVIFLGKSPSEPNLVSIVVDEHASLFDVRASERWRAACTVPHIRSLGIIFVRNSYRIFVAFHMYRAKTVCHNKKPLPDIL